jgi:hypothetical protein
LGGKSWYIAAVRSVGETRKLAAILVADIVGYSRLASVDLHLTF